MTETEAKPRGGGPAPGGPGRARRGPRFAPPGRRTVLVALIAVTVLTAAGTWAVYGSPWFRATGVDVAGTVELTPDQVERAARVPLGGALVSVDTGAVRARLLKALPRVAEATVRRSWPHTIRVTVRERTAAAALRTGAAYTEVDRDGVRFATVPSAPRGVPLLRLEPVQSASLRRFGTAVLLRAAITVAGDLPVGLRGQAGSIVVRSYDGITVELSGGRSVMWGSAEEGAVKARVLTALMKAQPRAARYDVSAPTAPAVSGS